MSLGADPKGDYELVGRRGRTGVLRWIYCGGGVRTAPMARRRDWVLTVPMTHTAVRLSAYYR
jgi:hypothetical protein